MTTITINRALLEQALDALEAAKNGLLWYQDTYPDATNDSDDEAMGKIDSALETLRAELAKPTNAEHFDVDALKSELDLVRSQLAAEQRINSETLHVLNSTEQKLDSLIKSAELAKPVERVEPITLDQFRAIANRTATTYRHRSDPDKSSYAFVDGSSLDDFWRKVREAIQPTSAWHDAPETLALKAERDKLLAALHAMLTHMGMDEDEWNKPTFDQARAAIAKAEGRKE